MQNLTDDVRREAPLLDQKVMIPNDPEILVTKDRLKNGIPIENGTINKLHKLAEKYYIPLLSKWKIDLKDKKILDIGCGDGGFISAFSNHSPYLNGVEIKDFKWVLSIFEGIDWVDPDSEFYDEPYIMIDGWMGGFLDYPQSELKDAKGG